MRLPISQVIVVIISIVVASAVIAVTGFNIIFVLTQLVYGAFGTPYYFSETIARATPLILTGLAFTVAIKGGYWNIGGEGQAWVGALFAATIGIFLNLPFPLHAIVAALGALVGGALWGLIPGVLKAKLEVNEVLTTLMMNYVAYWIAYYVINWPLKDQTVYAQQTYFIKSSAIFPPLVTGLRAHSFLIVALLGAIVAQLILSRTRFGHEILSLGSNLAAARSGGVNVPRTYIKISLVSGALAGLAGGSEVLGFMHNLDIFKLSGLGYLGIGVSVLGVNAIGAIFAAVFVGALISGADNMQRALGLRVSDAAVNVFTGTTIMCALLVPALLVRLYRIWKSRGKKLVRT